MSLKSLLEMGNFLEVFQEFYKKTIISIRNVAMEFFLKLKSGANTFAVRRGEGGSHFFFFTIVTVVQLCYSCNNACPTFVITLALLCNKTKYEVHFE